MLVADEADDALGRPPAGRGHVVGAIVAAAQPVDVLARVAVLGHRLARAGGRAALAPRRRIWPPRVVDVVLAGDRRGRSARAAGRGRRRRTANQPLPTWSGPVGLADTNSTFDPLAVRRGRAGRSRRRPPRRRRRSTSCSHVSAQAEVDEAGPGDLDRARRAAAGRRSRCSASSVGQLARVAAGRLGRGQRHVGRPVAVLAAAAAARARSRRGRIDPERASEARTAAERSSLITR